MAGHNTIVLSHKHPVSALLNHTYQCLDKINYATNIAVRLINSHSKHTGCLMKPDNDIAFGRHANKHVIHKYVLYCTAAVLK